MFVSPLAQRAATTLKNSLGIAGPSGEIAPWANLIKVLIWFLFQPLLKAIDRLALAHAEGILPPWPEPAPQATETTPPRKQAPGAPHRAARRSPARAPIRTTPLCTQPAKPAPAEPRLAPRPDHPFPPSPAPHRAIAIPPRPPPFERRIFSLCKPVSKTLRYGKKYPQPLPFPPSLAMTPT